ncbi:MAG TPA: polymer-forming cytoskeletal protein [Aliidongia sp.]|uniref:bactofilin family protein n=1 Tax=Aliidongia sp. TaxID=1914230 RepID=UPI002DDDB894|nr:polymer-forming cytoskeletal protein [Aliidongia sp.]HEV2675401.1 polymer-forming cytoskeletal protein [Aliidongia sp.]
MSIELPRRPATPFSAVPSALTPVEVETKTPPDAPKTETKARQMRVGRGITLSGEIKGCDWLLVEGSVEATLLECSAIEIAGSGVFKGTATVDNAEISGRFEGSLTLRKRLFIRQSGRVSGEIRYGQLEVECGGRLSGDIGSEEVTPRRD